MKYKDSHKEKAYIELDDMNIKSHLNASLELDGISVSEDLINRTLEAIKKQETERVTKGEDKTLADLDSKKVLPWSRYIRSIATVAAAAAILIAGISFFNNLGMKKEDRDSSMKFTSSADNSYASSEVEENYAMSSQIARDKEAGYDGATSDTVDMAGFAAEATTETAPEFSIAAGIIEEEGENSNSTGNGKEDVDDATTDVNIDKTIVGSAKNYKFGASSSDKSKEEPVEEDTILSFRTIFLSEPEKAEYVTITDNDSRATVTLTEQADILDFYEMMDKHQFIYGEETALSQNYTVEIGHSEADATYIMTIGDYIIVSYQDQLSSSQSIYDVLDKDLLTEELKDFIRIKNK